MVVLKSQSQVRSFVKRQTAFHNKNTTVSHKFCDDPDDPNGYGIEATVSIDGNRVLLSLRHWMSGLNQKNVEYFVIAIIKISTK